MFPRAGATTAPLNTKAAGDAAENAALAHLQQAGLRLLVRNYRTPGRGGGEIDLIMRAPDGTCVFVEVRQRRSSSHGGAAASVSRTKQARIVFAARHYLMRLHQWPACRFDVVAVDAGVVTWIVAAFQLSSGW
jgi:putative endonuclease